MFIQKIVIFLLGFLFISVSPPAHISEPLIVKTASEIRANRINTYKKAIEKKEDRSQIKFIRKKVRKINPRVNEVKIANSIITRSKKYNLSPFLIASIVRSESTFNKYALSSAGAVGLMQVLPTTANYIADMRGIDRHNLWDENSNIDIGLEYLDYLKTNFRYSDRHMLMAYNWGPASLNKYLNRKRKLNPGVLKYALKIINTAQKWESEYEKIEVEKL